MATSECVSDLEKAETLHCSDQPRSANLEKFKVDFENQENCDVTVVSADGEFKVMAHKSILGSASRYFQAVFGWSHGEAEEREIKLNQFDGRTLKALLDFIYKGKVELTPETAASVLEGAHILEIEELLEQCCTYMKNNMGASDCLGISQFAKLYNLDQLESAAVLCVCENFVALRKEEEFLSLSLEDLCELISKDDLRMSCEADVLRNILAWMHHREEDRQQHFEHLLSFVRFPLLSRAFVDKFLDDEVKSPDMQRIIRLTQERTVDGNATGSSYKKCKVRNFKDVFVVIKGLRGRGKDLSVAFYYFGSNEWIYTKWPSLFHYIGHVKCAILGRNFIVTDRGFGSLAVHALNLETLEWKELPRIARAYSFFTLNGVIYSTGDHRFWKLEEPFKKWVRVRIPVEAYPSSLDLCATYKNLFYFKYGPSYATYDSTDDSFNMEKIQTVECYENMSYADAVHISRHLGSDYLVEHAKVWGRDNDLHITHVYDLNTSACIRTFSNEIPRYKRLVVFGHGEHFIRYLDNKFVVFDLFGTQVRILPPLTDDDRKVDAAFGNSNL